METQLAVIDPKQYGLEEKKATEIRSGLNSILQEREVLEVAFKDVITLEICEENLPEFKALRLMIVKNRTQGIEKWHKVNKEFYLAGGRFVDAIKNKEIAENVRMEAELATAEKHFETLEKERVDALQKERVEKITPYIEDATGLYLGDMDEDIFDGFLTGTIAKFEARKQAEKEAEEKRIEDERIEKERLEAQRVENERLKKEAEKREKEIEFERKLNEQKLAEERAIAKKAADKIEAENNAKHKAEREAREKLEAELKAERDAKIKEAAKKEAEELRLKKEAEKNAKAPIKKQMSLWVDSFSIAEINIENDKKALIKTKFEAFKKWAKSEIESI